MKLNISENVSANSDNIFRTDSKGITWKYRIADDLGEELERFFRRTSSVNESNLSRINTYVNNGCFMISACRAENDEETNKANTDKLADDIRSYDLGYIRVLGGYAENSGEEDEREVQEESFFVPQPENVTNDEFFDIAIALCKKYNQDSVLISMPGYIDFGYYTGNGEFDFSPDEKLSFSDEAVKQYFSALIKGSNRNKKWSFTTEWLAVRNPGTHYQAVVMDKNKENLLFKK